jgi:hypothetical protein
LSNQVNEEVETKELIIDFLKSIWVNLILHKGT